VRAKRKNKIITTATRPAKAGDMREQRSNQMQLINRSTLPILIASLAIVCAVACGVRRGDDVLLPSGFEGWVLIHYEVSGRPELERDGFRNVIRVSESGAISTSSTRAVGYSSDAYYFVDSGGKRQPIRNWNEECKADEVCVQQFQIFSSPSMTTRFFVGRKANRSRYPQPNVE
jgi:uncharacterized protein DUF6843